MNWKHLVTVLALVGFALTASAGGGLPIVTGSTHTTDLPPGTGLRTQTFQLVEYVDGTVDGHVQVVRHDGAGHLHIQVGNDEEGLPCYYRDDSDTVILFGQVTQASSPSLVGRHAAVGARDGGDSDEVTPILFTITPEGETFSCTQEWQQAVIDVLLANFFPVESGNLIVRP